MSPAPVIAVEAAPPAAGPVPIQAPTLPASPAARSISAEDVRRVQMRLRDAGFDPGPIDGIAGPKTRMAFAGLAAGCARLEKPLQEPRQAAGRGPEREEVMRIQSELRAAGFNPGPIDGIYGVRTKSLVMQLPAACAIAEEFAQGFDGAPEQGSARFADGAAAEHGAAAAHAPVKGSDEAARPAVAGQTAQSREEVRILQLRLRDAGLDPGPFDGIMGVRTRTALAQYEASQRNGKVKTSLETTRISGQY